MVKIALFQSQTGISIGCRAGRASSRIGPVPSYSHSARTLNFSAYRFACSNPNGELPLRFALKLFSLHPNCFAVERADMPWAAKLDS